MKIEDIKVKHLKQPELRNKVISIRTTKSISRWMKKNKVSPSQLFNQCVEIVMKQNGSSKPTKK